MNLRLNIDMKVKYFKPNIFFTDTEFFSMEEVLALISKEPNIMTVGRIVRAYMAVDRTGRFNPFDMAYDPIPKVKRFSKSFEDCCMSAAKKLWSYKKPIELFWSGGIDSSGALIALVETKSKSNVLNVRYTKESIAEFPLMWEKIVRHLNDPIPESEILDDELFMNDDIIKVTGECGDQLFGSDALHKNLDKQDNEWETIFKWDSESLFGSDDLKHFENRRMNLIEVLSEHIESSPVEIVNIFDLYWWLNFSLKWQDVDSRMIFTYTTCPKWQSTLSFYNTEYFQKWSIVNHDIKHNGTWETYKQPAKDYINKYVKDESYRKNKTKEASLIKNLVGSTDDEYTYEFRQKRRNSPAAMKLALDDGTYFRTKDFIPKEYRFLYNDKY